MSGDIRKLILGVILLIEGIMFGNCLAKNETVSGQLQINESTLKYSITLEKQGVQLPAVLKIFCSFPKSTTAQTISCTMSDKPWMKKAVLRERFLQQVTEKIKSPDVLLALPAYLETLSNQINVIAQQEEIEQLQASIKAINKTLEFVSNPTRLSGLIDLPQPNKVILLDIAARLIEEGKSEFSNLRDALQDKIHVDNPLTFDTAANTINRGFQSGQDYKKYTQIDNPENLAHLIHCFVVSKGYEIQKIDPPISMENLQILIRRIVDNSENDNKFCDLAEQLENIMRQQ